MTKLKLGIAALLSFPFAAATPAAAVSLGLGGDLGYRRTYGVKGSDLSTFLGCTPTCGWTFVVDVPNTPGPLFTNLSVALKLNQNSYAITGTISSNYVASNTYDLMTFTGTGLAVPVPGMTGDELLYFNFSFRMPKGTLLHTNKRPPTDPDIYLTKLLAGSQVEVALRNFPGNSSGESGVVLSTYNSLGTPSYPVTKFTSTGAFAVPEPATWTMLIGGFAVAGAGMRRRKRLAIAV